MVLESWKREKKKRKNRTCVCARVFWVNREARERRSGNKLKK